MAAYTYIIIMLFTPKCQMCPKNLSKKSVEFVSLYNLYSLHIAKKSIEFVSLYNVYLHIA